MPQEIQSFIMPHKASCDFVALDVVALGMASKAPASSVSDRERGGQEALLSQKRKVTHNLVETHSVVALSVTCARADGGADSCF